MKSNEMCYQVISEEAVGGMDAISVESVRSALKEVRASTVKIKSNSGGGDVIKGVEIYN
ncbi:hypothetical protein ACT7C1_18115 [Bacillus paranthracis]